MTIWQGLIVNGTEVINNPWVVGNMYFNTKGVIDTTEPYAGVGTATTGAPRIYFGGLTPSNDDSCIKICRNIAGSNLFSHAVRDESTFNSLVSGAYASFDAIPTLTGNIVYNHLNSFQSRQQYTGGGTLTDSLGFTYALTTSGHVVASSAFRVYDYAGAGVVDNFYALYIPAIVKPTAHWSIYSLGTSRAYHAGNFGIGTTNPLSLLSVQGDTAAPTVFQDGNNGQVHVSSPGLVNTVVKLTFGTPNYAGAGGNAAIGVQFTGGGTHLLFGTSNSYAGLSNTALDITPAGNLDITGNITKTGDIVLDPSTEITEVCGVGLKTKEYNATVNDGVTISLPTNTIGWGTVMIGDNREFAQFRWTSAAVVTLDEATVNVANADTAGNLCIFDGGASVSIRNRLGVNLVVRYVIHYS
jgi:hypothetical protein